MKVKIHEEVVVLRRRIPASFIVQKFKKKVEV